MRLSQSFKRIRQKVCCCCKGKLNKTQSTAEMDGEMSLQSPTLKMSKNLSLYQANSQEEENSQFIVQRSIRGLERELSENENTQRGKDLKVIY